MICQLSVTAIVLVVTGPFAGAVSTPASTSLNLIRDAAWSIDWKLFQRDATGQARIPLHFMYQLDEPGAFQARVTLADTGAVLEGHDWKDHTLLLPPGSAEIEFDVTGVPTGGNYHVMTRLVSGAGGLIQAVDVLRNVAVGDVYLSAGQSNMSGFSEPDPDAAEMPIDEVHLFGNDYVWKRAIEPMDSGENQVDEVSLDFPNNTLMLRFGKDVYAATGVPVAIIPGPLNGSNLFVQWQRDAGNPANRDTLYGSLLFRAMLQNYDEPPRGYLWFQGESDAIFARSTTEYRADLEELVAEYRADLGAPGLFFLNVQLGTSPFVPLAQWLNVQEAQRQAARADEKMALATCVDQPRVDNFHYTSEGYKIIGARLAEAALETAYDLPVNALTELRKIVRWPGGMLLVLLYDSELAQGPADVSLFTVSDGFGNNPVRSAVARGRFLILRGERPVQNAGTVTYGWSDQPTAGWVRGAAGRPVPSFKAVPFE